MSDIINIYQRKVWKEYKQHVGLNDNYKYLYGNPVKVHVPIDTAKNGLMIIGAYPTAHFNVIDGIRDVPVEDHLYPFSNEEYFDGSSVNFVKSGKEIEEYFLDKLNIKRTDCWITDLVKVFLFKEGHIKKYESLIKKNKELGVKEYKETRSLFNELGYKSINYMEEEILLAEPKVIIGLGSEVNEIMLRSTGKETLSAMKDSREIDYVIREKTFKYFPVPHPGILMRNTIGSTDWRNVLDNSLEKVKEYL